MLNVVEVALHHHSPASAVLELCTITHPPAPLGQRGTFAERWKDDVEGKC